MSLYDDGMYSLSTTSENRLRIFAATYTCRMACVGGGGGEKGIEEEGRDGLRNPNGARDDSR